MANGRRGIVFSHCLFHVFSFTIAHSPFNCIRVPQLAEQKPHSKHIAWLIKNLSFILKLEILHESYMEQ